MTFSKDTVTGLFFVLFAAGTIVTALHYGWGDPMRIGPAFFPICVAIALAIVGVVLVLRGLRAEGMRIGTVPWRPILFLLAGPAFFAATIKGLGFALAFAGLTLLGCLAFPRPDWRVTAAVVPLLTAACYLAFVVGLRVNIPLLGPWIGG